MFSKHSLKKITFVFALAALASLCPSLYARDIEIIDAPEMKLLDEEGAGKLYQVGEHLVLVMEGTHEEMGFQHGRLLAKHIVHIMKEGYAKKGLWDRYMPELCECAVGAYGEILSGRNQAGTSWQSGLKAAGIDDSL